jgi:UDP-N-acetylglucosamine diphosphorylase / glucose-1-phosphate thymidylyltransferase / UDP-N-acetylgalactosamine diphosphorylase / glucosamine-1-phosphate N-acetyltransferase / galactosamine-1-phosphate N-acetyltransferase
MEEPFIFAARELFDWPENLPFGTFFPAGATPWQWVSAIATALESEEAAVWFAHAEESLRERSEPIPAGVSLKGAVYLHPTVKLPPYAVIEGPVWIGAHTEIRPGAYLRGKVIVGEHCVLGNSCEFKNSLLLDNVQAPHFNYVGDSVLGNRSHLGAGVICANLRLDQKAVEVRLPGGQRAQTGMRKLGTLVADDAEAGCNSVLQPGTILGRRSAVISMPFQGYLPPNTLALPAQSTRTLPRP